MSGVAFGSSRSDSQISRSISRMRRIQPHVDDELEEDERTPVEKSGEKAMGDDNEGIASKERAFKRRVNGILIRSEAFI